MRKVRVVLVQRLDQGDEKGKTK